MGPGLESILRLIWCPVRADQEKSPPEPPIPLQRGRARLGLTFSLFAVCNPNRNVPKPAFPVRERFNRYTFGTHSLQCSGAARGLSFLLCIGYNLLHERGSSHPPGTPSSAPLPPPDLFSGPRAFFKRLQSALNKRATLQLDHGLFSFSRLPLEYAQSPVLSIADLLFSLVTGRSLR